jgi:tetratricopeptide (TPR) repeat protein
MAATRKGKCIQFGLCSIADAREAVEVQPGEEFACKECGKPLQEAAEGGTGGSRKKALVIASAIIVIAAGVAAWVFWPRGSHYPEEPPIAEGTPKPPSQKPEAPQSSETATPCGLNAVSQPDVNRLLTYLKQGMTYASQKRYDLALNEFEQVRQIDPNFLAMHENIAAAQLKLKQTSDAETHLQEELKLVGCLDQMNDAELPRFAYTGAHN